MGEKPTFGGPGGPETSSAERQEGVNHERPKPRFGANVSMLIEFARHEQPGQNPEGRSLDYLTPTGQERSAARGKTIDKPAVKSYASPKLRAQETGDLALQNVDKDVRIINQKLTERLKTVRKGQKPENEFVAKIRPELDTISGWGEITADGKSWVEGQMQTGSKRSKLDLQIQYYLNHPERAKALGTTTPEEAAGKIAYAVNQEVNMGSRLYSNSDIMLRNITHGPNLEPFLQQVMINKDGTRGFKDLGEIGGSFDPGESFQVDVKTDNDKKISAQLLFRGGEYDIDLARVQELADQYRQRKEKAEPAG